MQRASPGQTFLQVSAPRHKPACVMCQPEPTKGLENRTLSNKEVRKVQIPSFLLPIWTSVRKPRVGGCIRAAPHTSLALCVHAVQRFTLERHKAQMVLRSSVASRLAAESESSACHVDLCCRTGPDGSAWGSPSLEYSLWRMGLERGRVCPCRSVRMTQPSRRCLRKMRPQSALF